jgi:hypothetical protein
MLKTLFGKGSREGRAKDALPGSARTRMDLAQVRTLIDFFPIGKKLRYYPEFQREIVFDTLVVAYGVNGHFIYSADSIERDDDGVPRVFHCPERGMRIPATAIHLFQLLVPDTSELETKLDYHRWGIIGRGRQFNAGNCISLISNSGVKGVSTVDTEVAKQVNLPDGPYATTNLVLLTPDLSTLSITDQRRKVRTKINAPVKLALPDNPLARLCTIVDISEGELRLRVREHGTSMPELARGDIVFIETELGEAERHYFMKASVIRRSGETCVVHLEGQLKDGKLRPLAPLDLLELKAGLLNYGK